MIQVAIPDPSIFSPKTLTHGCVVSGLTNAFSLFDNVEAQILTMLIRTGWYSTLCYMAELTQIGDWSFT